MITKPPQRKLWGLYFYGYLKIDLTYTTLCSIIGKIIIARIEMYWRNGGYMTEQVTKMKVLVTADTTQADEAAKRSAQKLKDSYKVSASNLARQNSQDSGTARGLGGLTGASARDFASQSQGLGGVVRLYATFAANLFAASAAFGALSRAADTTNMVKGLDQLGAASGRALGSLSKQLVAATNGAINLRDAMSATALGASGGMSDATILRLGNAAQKASLALGIAMPDAISRLSRGIVKLEPELLDEIGIMVRVDKVTQDYAKSVGKSALAVTDFEKRQAFANAVLDQAEKKFGAIKIDSNPYAKLLASTQNLVQSGLELINGVLSPIVTLLSSSPTGLATAMALVAATLLKQALPAIGSIKDSLRASADEATALAQEKYAQVQKGLAAEYSAVKNSALAKAKIEKDTLLKATKEKVVLAKIEADAIAERSVDAVTTAQEKVNALKAGLNKKSVALAIANTPIQEITDKNISSIRLSALSLENRGLTESATKHRELANAIELSKKEHINYAQIVAQGESKMQAARDEAAKSIRNTRNEYRVSAEDFAKNEISNQTLASTSRQTQIIANRELLSSVSRSIVAQAAETASINGVSAAWKESRNSVALARKGIQEYTDASGAIAQRTIPAMGAIQGYWTLTKTGISSATAAMGTLLSAFGIWFAVIGIAVAAIQGLYTWASRSREAMDKFNSSIEGLNSAAKTAGDTVDALLAKDGKEMFSAESIQARANSFLTLADTIKASVEAFEKLEKLKNPAEKFVDSLYALFGNSDSQELTEGISKNIASSLALLQDPKVKQQYADAIKQLLGGDVELTDTGINKALRELTEPRRQGALRELGKLTKTIAMDLGNNSANLQGFSTALGTLEQSVKGVYNSLKASDPLSKVGMDGLNALEQLDKALKDPQNSLETLTKLLNSPTNGLMGTETLTRMMEGKKLLEELSTEAKTSQVALSNYLGSEDKVKEDRRISAVKETRNQSNAINSTKASSITGPDGLLLKNRGKIPANEAPVIDQRLVALNAAAAAASTRLKEVQENQAKLIKSALEETKVLFTGYILRAENAAVTLAKLSVEKTKLGIDASYGADTFKAQASIINQEAGIKLAEINSQEMLALATANAASRMEELTDVLRQANILTTLQNSANETNPARKLNLRSFEVLTEELAQIDRKRAERAGKFNPEILGIQSAARANRAGVLGTRDGAQLSNADGKAKFDANVERDNIESAIKLQEITKAKLGFQKQFNVAFDEEAERRAFVVEEQIQYLKYTQEESKLREQLRGLSNSTDEEAKKRVKDKLSALEIDSDQKSNQDTLLFNYKLGNDKIAEATRLRERSLEIEKLNLDIINSQNSTKLSELSYLRDIGVITESKYNTEKAALDVAREKNNLAVALKSIEGTKTSEIESLTNRATASNSNINTGQFAAEKKIIEQNAATKAAAATASATASIIEIEKSTERNNLQSVFNDQLKITTDITTTLSSLFGEMGANIGTAAEALTKMAQTDTEYMGNRIKLQEKLYEAQTLGAMFPELEKDAKKDIDTLDKKHAKNQLTNIGNVAGASKKMFKENTVAYKVLDGLEKAAGLLKLATLAKELAMEFSLITAKTTSSAVGVSGAAAEATMSTMLTAIKAKEGIAQIWSKTPPWVAVGMTAAFLGLLGISSGGGGAGGYSGPSVEDIQTNQNTGMSYVDGKYKENGRGVFGDASATSDSVNKSLALIAETSVKGMSYSNKTVDLLTAIKDNTTQAAVALYGVQGVRSGSALGTREGSSSNPGFLGAFGSSNSTTIDNTGIKLGGTFANAVVKGFETVTESRSKSGFFGIGASSSSETSDRAFALPAGVETSITKVFTSAGNLLKTQGEKLGLDSKVVESILSSFSLEGKQGSLKGLSGEDLTNALNALISSSIDEVSQLIFPEIDKFKNMGEGFFETVARVLDTSEKVGQAFASIGSTNTVQSLKVLDEKLALTLPVALAKSAGGLSEFISLTENFGTTFLTEFEQLAPQAAVLGSEMVRLGYSTITTRDEFKNLVTGFKVTDEATAETYVSLLKLAPAFDSVIGYVEQLTGLTSNSLSDLFRDGLLGRLDASELGKQVSEKIEEGIYNAIANQFANQISSMFVDQIVTPLVMSLVTPGAIVKAISIETLDSIVAAATSAAQALSTLFNDAGFIAALDAIKEAVTGVALAGTQVSRQPYTYTPKEDKTASNEADAAKKAADEQLANLNEQLVSLVDERKLAGIELLVKQRLDARNKLLSNEAKIVFDLINLEKDLAEARKQQLNETQKLEALFTNTADSARLRETARVIELAAALNDTIRNTIKFRFALEDLALAQSNYNTAADKYANQMQKVLNIAKTAITARNTALQESYTDSLTKKQEAEEALNDYTKETIDSLKTLTKDLRKFLEVLDSTSLGGTSSMTQLEKVRAQFERTLTKARLGDKAASESLPEVATKLLELSKDTSSTSVSYARDVAKVRNAITSVISLNTASSAVLSGTIKDSSTLTENFDTLTVKLKKAIEDVLYWEVKAKQIGVVLDAGTTTAREKYKVLEDDADNIIKTLIKFHGSLDTAGKLQLEQMWETLEKENDFTFQMGIAVDTLKEKVLALKQLSIAKSAAQIAADTAGYIQYNGGTVDGKPTPSGTISKPDAATLIKELTAGGSSAADILNAGINGYGTRASDIITAGIASGVSGFDDVTYGKGGGIIDGKVVGSSYYDLSKVRELVDSIVSSSLNASSTSADKKNLADSLRQQGVSNYGLDASLVDSIVSGAIPGFKVGTNYIQKDMIAQLHEGEAVVPKAYNPAAGNGGNNELLVKVIAELKSVKDELQNIRKEQFEGNYANVMATKTVTSILRDVTADGTSITTISGE